MLCCLAPAQAQQYQFNNADGQEQKSTDPRNRARIHTELGAMYFQAGNYAVALDELQIALNADSSYYQAYSVRGLVRTALKENDKAESDFRRALDIARTIPRLTTTTAGICAKQARKRQSIASLPECAEEPALRNAGSCLHQCRHLRPEGRDLRGAELSAQEACSCPRRCHRRGWNWPSCFYRRAFWKSRALPERCAEDDGAAVSRGALAGVRIERKLGNRAAEGGFASQLRSRYPSSMEYQEFLKGNFE